MSSLKTSLQVSLLSVFVLSNFSQMGFANSVNHTSNKLTQKSSTQKAKVTAPLASLIKSDDIWSILENAAVKQSMKAVMGDAYPLFKERTQQLGSLEVKGDEIFSQGGVEGLYTIQESALDFNTKTNRAQVAILDDNSLNIWGAANNAELTKQMRAYVTDLQSRKSDVTVNLKFQPPNKSTIAFETEARSKSNPHANSAITRPISFASPVGTYERESKWDGGTLQIVKLNGNKIKFALSAAHGANSGGASGIVDLVNNKATYKGEGFKLVFDYEGKSVFVSETGDGFGGMNVRADGTYKKTDDKVPTIDDSLF